MTKEAIIHRVRTHWHLLETEVSRPVNAVIMTVYRTDTPNIYEMVESRALPLITFRSSHVHSMFEDQLEGAICTNKLSKELDIFRSIRGSLDKIHITKPTYHEIANAISTHRQEA